MRLRVNVHLLWTFALTGLESLSLTVVGRCPPIAFDIEDDQLTVTAHSYHLDTRTAVTRMTWLQAKVGATIRARPGTWLLASLTVHTRLER